MIETRDNLTPFEIVPAGKLKVFLLEEDAHDGEPLFITILHLLRAEAIIGATVFKAEEGFGQRRIIHTNKLEIMSFNLPITIEATDAPEKIDAVAAKIAALPGSGLVEVSRSSMLRPLAKPNIHRKADKETPLMLTKGSARKLIIYVSDQCIWQNQPAYEAIIRFLHDHGCAGATMTKAVAGFGAGGQYHTAKLFQLRDNLPMRIEVIDTQQKIDAVLPSIYEMVSDGLIEVQDTEVIKYVSRRTNEKETGVMTEASDRKSVEE